MITVGDADNDDDGTKAEPLVNRILGDDKYIEKQNRRWDNQKYCAMKDILEHNIQVAQDNYFKRTDEEELLQVLLLLFHNK